MILKWHKWAIITVAVLVVFSASLGFFTSFILSRFSSLEMLLTISPQSNSFNNSNVLLLGIDTTQGVQRSDTIMVIHVDSQNKKVNVVSIPRDTLVVIPSVRLDKINHAYAFGGPELACTTTSNFLNVPIPHYIKINVDGFEKLIDRLGGVTIDVEKRMYYVDYAGGLFIDLKPGIQRLNGKQAIGYLRFRHDASADIGRISRQQKFLQAVGNEIARTHNIAQIYSFIMDFMNCVETNLSPSQIMGIASQIRQAYEMGNISMEQIPGQDTMIDKVSYFQPNMDEVSKIALRYLSRAETAESVRDN